MAKIGCMPVESVTKSWIDRQLSRIYKCLQRCNQQQNTTIKKKNWSYQSYKTSFNKEKLNKSIHWNITYEGISFHI